MSSPSDVQQFFDQLAPGYRKKYLPQNTWHYYFFTERMNEALDLAGIKSGNECVLDVGAGTGDLYDVLYKKFPSIDYHASDISSAMLAQSHIPQHHRHIGELYELRLAEHSFDVVFMLGVSTYMNNAALEKNIRTIYRLLKPGGSLIITFTNRNSIDWKMRRALRWLTRLWGTGDKVMTKLKVFPRTHDAADDILSQQFDCLETRWLNHTIFPFYLPLKKIAVRLAMRLHPRLQHATLRSWLSSDFMIVAEPIPHEELHS